MSETEKAVQTPRRGTRARKSTAKVMELEEKRSRKRETVEDSFEEDEFSGEEVQITDTVREGNVIAGKDIYSFDKIKRHERLVPETPSKSKLKSAIPKTPHHLRKKLGKGIKSVIENLSSGDEEPYADSGSEYSGSDGSSSESEASQSDQASDASEENIVQQPTARRLETPAKRGVPTRQAAKNNKYIIKTEEYFSNNANQKTATSNHTLDKLETPRLSQEQLQKLLAKMTVSKRHQKAVCNFANTAREQFNKWMCLLHENFNILLYGLGSKKSILNQFHSEMLKDLPVIVVNGFFPSLTLKDILDGIIHDMLELTESTANVFDACEVIEREFEAIPEQHLYMIVHNIEGDMLRNNKSQSVLARLSNIRNVHLITSIDHINAPLIWDHNKLSKFKFIWWDVTSFLPYTDETSFESSMMVQRTGNLALSSLRNVFLSLTSNSKGIYMIILKYQLENNKNQYYQGLLFKDLYGFCREAFLVSSDLALRAQLTEFIDHKMVKMRRSADGGEYLMIPIQNNLLQQFANEQSK